MVFKRAENWVKHDQRQCVPRGRTRDSEASLIVSRRSGARYCQFAVCCGTEMSPTHRCRHTGVLDVNKNTIEKWQLWRIATWGRLTWRQSFSALMTMSVMHPAIQLHNSATSVHPWRIIVSNYNTRAHEQFSLKGIYRHSLGISSVLARFVLRMLRFLRFREKAMTSQHADFVINEQTTILGVFFTVQIEHVAYFYFRFIWPNDLEQMSHCALCTKI